MSVSATPHSPNPALNTVDPGCMSATASSASLNSLDFERSIFGVDALMHLREFVNRHCGAEQRAARSCEGSGRREHMRVGRAASNRYEEGRVSILW